MRRVKIQLRVETTCVNRNHTELTFPAVFNFSADAKPDDAWPFIRSEVEKILQKAQTQPCDLCAKGYPNE